MLPASAYSRRLGALDVVVALLALVGSVLGDALVAGLVRGVLPPFWAAGLGHLAGAVLFGVLLWARLGRARAARRGESGAEAEEAALADPRYLRADDDRSLTSARAARRGPTNGRE